MIIDNFKFKLNTFFTIFIHGKSGVGKTTYVLNYLDDHDIEYSYTAIQEMKSEKDFFALFDNRNVINMFLKKKKGKKVIVIDNVDYLQNNDKKVISCITKFLKGYDDNKYKDFCVIFIGNNKNDKKVIELKSFIDDVIVFDDDIHYTEYDKNMKEVVADILNKSFDLGKPITNEKTIVSLCYHENIIHLIGKNYSLYYSFLKNFCKGDFYDRIAFQKQLWQFNEMSFYVKVLHNYIIFKNCGETIKKKFSFQDVIFTKILTKYSNEYSNNNYIINLCNRFNIQKYELRYVLEGHEKYKNFVLTSLEKKRVQKLIG